MKTIGLFFLALTMSFISVSQVININLDTTGPPYIVGPQPVITADYLNSLTKVRLSEAAMSDSIPSS